MFGDDIVDLEVENARLRAELAEAHKTIEFWACEGEEVLCDEDREWRDLAGIPDDDRTEVQTERMRFLANEIRRLNDAPALRKHIAELEQQIGKMGVI